MALPCTKFCCSSFNNYQDLPFTGQSDLTNHIHPILNRDRFQENVDYTLIEMPLRLASHFLALPNVVRHMVIMTDGELDALPGGCSHVARYPGPRKHPGDANGYPSSNYNSSDYHSDVDDNNYYHWRANEILQQAAEHVQFHIDVSSPDQKRSQGGSTRRRADRLTADQAVRLGASGAGSDIYLGDFHYGQFKHFATQIAKGEIINAKQKAGSLCSQFDLARLVVHELSHALENLYMERRRFECFCEGNTLSERGFDMETAIFGGLPDVAWSRCLMDARVAEYCTVGKEKEIPNPVMVLYPWPNQIFADMYLSKNLKMGFLPQAANRPIVADRVPLDFIEGLFSTAYWDQASRGGQRSIIFPSVGAWELRWYRSDIKDHEAVHPWLTVAEAQSGHANNQPNLLANIDPSVFQ